MRSHRPTSPSVTPENAGGSRILKLFRSAEANQKQEVSKMEHFFRLYMNYRNDRDMFNWSQPRDIYPATREMTDKWGAELFIPLRVLDGGDRQAPHPLDPPEDADVAARERD
jgi:hypothetical protein